MYGFRERKRWRTVNLGYCEGMPMFLYYDHMMNRSIQLVAICEQTIRTEASIPRVRKSRYWGEMLMSPTHCCDVTKPPYLLSGELYTSPLHSNRLFVYTVCGRRRGQCFSVLRTRHTDVVDDSSGRSYVTEQWHIVPVLRTRGLSWCSSLSQS